VIRKVLYTPIHLNFRTGYKGQLKIKDLHFTTLLIDDYKMHVDSKHPTVLVSPSMDTGVSLDDDSQGFK
jgi:hypothetical protein